MRFRPNAKLDPGQVTDLRVLRSTQNTINNTLNPIVGAALGARQRAQIAAQKRKYLQRGGVAVSRPTANRQAVFNRLAGK